MLVGKKAHWHQICSLHFEAHARAAGFSFRLLCSALLRVMRTITRYRWLIMNDETISSPKAITLGTKVQLKEGVFKDVRIRQWEFSGVERGKVSLYRREGLILEVGMEDIDWERQEGPKVED